MIEPENPKITIERQCELLGISRSGYYYKPKGESAYNHAIMRLIDEEYTRHPFYGSRRLTAWLRRQGHKVNVKRVSRLMSKMGIEAVYQKPNLSKADQSHKKYPYLLGDLSVERPDQVWASDITYIRMNSGYVYLVVVMDWYSRYILSHEISTSLESEFCIVALEKALEKRSPDIFNTDQGSQFTCNQFTGVLAGNGVNISMDGKGRAFDNIFVERLWRSLKYEEVYMKDYADEEEAIRCIGSYIDFYNGERLHQSLCYNVPEEIYTGKIVV